MACRGAIFPGVRVFGRLLPQALFVGLPRTGCQLPVSMYPLEDFSVAICREVSITANMRNRVRVQSVESLVGLG